MKCFFYIILLLSNILLSSYAAAQEAKLVKQAEWGSGGYEHMVEVNGHYYIANSSGQVDVINPELTGEASLVAQIKLEVESEPSIQKISKFKDFLVIVTNDRIYIYSITDVTNLTKVYSVSALGDWNGTAVYQGDYLYYVDGDSKIFVIEEKEGVFGLANVVQLQKSNYDEELYISDRNLFIEDSTLYYLYRLQDNDTLSTKIESYQLDDLSLIDSGELENIGISGRGVYLGHGRFVISNYQYLYLIKLIDGQINILNDFDGVQYNKSFNLTVKDNIVKAISDSVLYTFRISDTNAISISSTESLTDYFLSNSYISSVDWHEDKLIGVNTKSGVFEMKLINDVIDSVAFSYNQSGYMGKAVIENNLIYLPRESRIDIVNIANIGNLTWQNSILEDVKDIERISDSLIFSNYLRISNRTIASDSDIQLSSAVSINSKVSPLLYKDNNIYHLNFDDEYSVMRHSVGTPFSLYEAPKEASIPAQTNSCPQELGLLADTLIAIDPCGSNRIHLFTDYDTDDFVYSRTIEHGLSYYDIVIGNEYIYLINPQGIKVVELTESDELVEVNSVDIPFSTLNGLSAETSEGYLFVSDGFYFYLFDISEPNLPTFISKAKTNDFEWRDANIQLEGGYILVTTKYQGQVKFFQLNKAPIANIVSLNVNEDEVSAPLMLFTDPELDPLTLSIIDDVVHGEVAIDGEEIVYTPNENFSGEDAILLKAEDIHGNFIEHEFLVTVNEINDVPTILTNVLSTNEDVLLTSELAFQDIENDDVEFHLLTEPTDGLASISLQGVLTYQPNNNFFGEDSLVVSITDENNGVSEKEIAIMVTAVNDAPIFTTTSYSVDEDNLLTGELKASDIEGQALTFELISNEDLQGNVNIESNGQFTFEPVLNFNGETSFSVKVSDSGANFSTEIITIVVNAVEDVPEPENTSLSLLFNGNVTQSLPTADVDGQSLSYRIVSDVKNGLLTLSEAGQYTYSPNAGFSGVDSFTYEVSDVNNNVAQATVSFTVQSAVEPKKAESSSGGSFGYFMLFSLIISFGFRAKRGREYGF